uniref:Phosphatase PP2A regulatory subunit A/Splicing factor 3B subunit 1-like HEAT repeat domain-containing protein n=1 Tax=Oryza rufipogon TaxID=4529 RepID=A0A0E0N9T9_ORYRU
MDAIDAELARAQEERKKMEEALAAGAPMAVSSVTFDTDLYGGGGSDPNRFAGYDTSIPASEDDAPEDESEAAVNPAARRLASYTGHAVAAADIPRAAEDDGLPKNASSTARMTIAGGGWPASSRRSAMIPSPLVRPPRTLPCGHMLMPCARMTCRSRRSSCCLRRKKEEEEKAKEKKAVPEQQPVAAPKRRNRWDQSQDGDASAAVGSKKAKTSSDWDAPDATPGIGRWDATPGRVGDATPSVRRNRWDETPTPGRMADADATPAAGGITPDKAREFGAGPLFNKILPLLMQPTIEDQERHLLVKVIDRVLYKLDELVRPVLYKLDELVRPFVHKILVVIEPLLIDEDYYARVEGREIISNLSKAAGLATMIAAMRPDIDNIDEYVRNTTARAFSVVASALGTPALLPFLKAVCQSKKSWQARHTGIKIVQQIAILMGCAVLPHLKSLIAILMGCAVLPHLKSLVEIIEHGLSDENQKVRTITALSLATLAEAAAPYGIESFDTVLKPLRMALDRRNYKQLVETTVEMANKVGVADIVGRIVEDLKDESEPYRRMVMETIEKVVANLGASDIDARLEELLIDGILQQAADLISRIAIVMKQCQEEQLMGHLGVVLYEYLGEEYPEVFGSILGALKAIVNVQENCIDLVGRIADRGAEFVPAREWMRICFELLEMLKAHKKGIRRATVNTFGYIAKAIGPQDVLATLLNNLKVQERQNRVCTTVAIAIVAETCSPFTVLPALMNEYRVPELNVQNGVLKSLSFLFEYIGAQDALVAAYPALDDDGDNIYSRPELAMFV